MKGCDGEVKEYHISMCPFCYSHLLSKFKDETLHKMFKCAKCGLTFTLSQGNQKKRKNYTGYFDDDSSLFLKDEIVDEVKKYKHINYNSEVWIGWR